MPITIETKDIPNHISKGNWFNSKLLTNAKHKKNFSKVQKIEMDLFAFNFPLQKPIIGPSIKRFLINETGVVTQMEAAKQVVLRDFLLQLLEINNFKNIDLLHNKNSHPFIPLMLIHP